MRLISGMIREDREFLQTTLALQKELSAARPLPLSVSGLADGARDAFLSSLVSFTLKEAKTPLLVLASDDTEARAAAAMLSLDGISAVHYPARDFVMLSVSASRDTERERLSILSRIASGEALAVVSTPIAALSLTMPRTLLKELSLSLSVGDECPPDRLAERLTALGFSRVELVEGVGQYARRGGIFDIYSSDALPVRIELFGDEIDRMGYFDPLTQRVTENAERVCVVPAREVLPSPEVRLALGGVLDAALRSASEEARHLLRAERALLDGGGDISYLDRYISLVYPHADTLFSYLRERRAPALVLADSGMREHTEALLAHHAEESTALVARGLLPSRYNRFFADYLTLENYLAEGVTVYITSFGNSYHGKSGGLFGFRSRRTVSYFGKEALLKEDIATLLLGHYRITVVTETASEAAALSESLRAHGLATVMLDADAEASLSLLDGAVGITHGALSAGFELISPRIAVLSTLPDEAARRRRRRSETRRRSARSAGQKIMSYADLSVGDYVVHTVHGIGRFEGMQQLRVDGALRDYITIRYAGSDSLFLPADRLEMIAKYIGAKSEDGSVKLSRLGGTDWQRAKSRAKSAAKDMARELVRLYAERQRREGFAFPPPSDMERDFADDFEFEETEPQLAAIAEIESDMEKPVPMDRLLCGDVGFGKTEVALRAAFKAIVGGKQVAILVPTTVLAMQHYQTVLSRMRAFPVDVGILSRLSTPKEQERTKRRLARGELDLIVGTHALLSKSITFKDLGLLIVDEEQRFGVAQKERLKTLATDVDVLTLTATPIPRTLNMAMSGIRDMSVLDEAPADRHPVATYVMEHDDVVIAEAIRKELARGGQVLYLYNRTASMERPLAKLSALFPEARITAAHGKMDKEELEDIWHTLLRGELDILVATTIIETGVDLPNANTLIIEDADRMGLAQLHQLRGRVGRSGRQAYAYFTYRRGKELSEIAEKRLKAIREYAEFGAGFKIALRDLEIRGAGNLLGAEQHGHIDSVGYDLYVKILNEAILEERGEVREAPFESQIDMAIDANIPEKYIVRSAERMEMYKKISLITSREDMEDVLDELSDRYGEVPKPLLRLLRIAVARAYAAQARIARIELRDGTLRFSAPSLVLSSWSELFARHEGLRLAGGAHGAVVSYRLSHGEDPTEALLCILSDYHEVDAQAANE